MTQPLLVRVRIEGETEEKKMKGYLAVILILLGFQWEINAQNDILSWPLNTNYTSFTYTNGEINWVGYTEGPGLTEETLDAEGGKWR